ncbi:hypothetical protein LTR84_011509 [Exophiala bonariae]|uniref:Uncharacterized protein n=1 Tax=Exophiala bonariae TaxID=1690606 RepID=A0AAV9NGN1_9EURO|nr:hypothetical protein LTR84_011509 [Exophiala bonariae]
MPGPSRPIFGMAYRHCKRCSSAAKTVRPMRMGGIGDKGDPYLNRCIFAGARWRFENGFEDEYEKIGENMRFSPEDAHAAKVIRPVDFVGRYDGYQKHGQNLPVGYPEYGEQQARPHKEGWKTVHDMRTLDSANITYSEDLDRYLAETYSSKIRLNT